MNANKKSLSEKLGQAMGQILREDPEVLEELNAEGGQAIRRWVREGIEEFDESLIKVVLSCVDWTAVYEAAGEKIKQKI
jgi:hypothetical protein